MYKFLPSLVMVAALQACGSSDSKSQGNSSSYNFESEAAASLLSSSLGLNLSQSKGKSLPLSGPEHLCETGQTITCTGVSDLTGKLLTVGLLIQAGGSGMQSYFLTENFSDVTANSTAYDFDFREPITTKGTLMCCGGSGDLSSPNSYFSNGSFLFSYLDASFTIPYLNPGHVSSEMRETHTVRFVMATNASNGYKRGDLLYKDSDGTFKWMDSSGTLSTTRPTTPLTMDKKVVDYVNPFEKGNTEIPVIGTEIISPAGGDEKVTTSETELKEVGTSYTFDFNAKAIIVFMLAPSELDLIQTKADIFKRIHLQGLPHSTFTFGVTADSTLIVEKSGALTLR